MYYLQCATDYTYKNIGKVNYQISSPRCCLVFFYCFFFKLQFVILHLFTSSEPVNFDFFDESCHFITETSEVCFKFQYCRHLYKHTHPKLMIGMSCNKQYISIHILIAINQCAVSSVRHHTGSVGKIIF